MKVNKKFKFIFKDMFEFENRFDKIEKNEFRVKIGMCILIEENIIINERKIYESL